MMTNKPIPSELFAPAERKDDADKITRPTIGFWKDVLRRLLQNKLAMFGFFLIVVMLIMAFVGPQISGYSY